MVEVNLKPGNYTILAEIDNILKPFNRFIDDHYPYVHLKHNDWLPIYFTMNGE